MIDEYLDGIDLRSLASGELDCCSAAEKGGAAAEDAGKQLRF